VGALGKYQCLRNSAHKHTNNPWQGEVFVLSRRVSPVESGAIPAPNREDEEGRGKHGGEERLESSRLDGK